MSSQAMDAGRAPATARSINWSPYLVGAGIGILSWVAFVVTAKPLGISTAISAIAGGAAAPIIGSEAVSANSYWSRYAMALDYRTLFLIGTFLGAMASSLAARTFAFETMPRVWEERFGPSRTKRFVAAFIGGALVLFGARMAGGCTSGNGISQTLQLAVVGWTFLAVMFASGLATAFVLFRVR